MSDDQTEARVRLAGAHGIVASFKDWRGRFRHAPANSLTAALEAMSVPCGTPTEIADSLASAEEQRAQRLLPEVVVARRGRPDTFRVALSGDARPDQVVVTLEGGSEREIPAGQAGQLGLVLPRDLPIGYHRLQVAVNGRAQDAWLLVAPTRALAKVDVRTWGWSVQLYATRSAHSWGVGDLADLRRLGTWAGSQGAAFVLCNPLHAAAPTVPQEPSPYYPSSRRFSNPLYLHVADVAEVARLNPADRERLASLAAAAQRDNHADRIDRDRSHQLKQEALALLWQAGRDEAREADLDRYRRKMGRELTDFATFCALAERHGPDFRDWPAELRHPRGPACETARQERAERVAFHEWQQWLCDLQLAGVQRAAAEAGMSIGMIHDLAVGVAPGGADAWALQDELAGQVRVGAPPDAFNQQGQNWQQPPLLPNRMTATGFAVFRDILRSVLRHAGGLRIDHILGLFRLWWIPAGASPADGVYVRYPAEGLLATLAIEAERAQALVIGEDLGTVGAEVRDALSDWGVFGTRVLYFERDRHGRFRSAQDYPEDVLATISTHDLPTATGWWHGEGVRLQAELGLLGEDTTPEAEQARAASERDDLAGLLAREGLVANDPWVGDLVIAMHAFLARTPAKLVAASLSDAVGDLRQPNLPGTIDEYPNWRLPLAEPGPDRPRPLLLEEVTDHPATAKIASLMHGAGRGVSRAVSGATVLVVEDQEAIRLLVQEVLEGAGYTVITARTGEEATLLAGGGHRVDLLVTDLTLPHIAGADLARRLRDGQPGLPVVYMSGQRDHPVGDDPAGTFLPKPFTLAELRSAVAGLLLRRDR